MYLTIEIVMEKSADFRPNNLSTTDKVVVFILDLVDIQDIPSIVLDEHRTNETFFFNLKKIHLVFCNKYVRLK